MGTKQAEIEYPNKLDARERQWLLTKPFGSFNRDESRRSFQDFSTLLTLIQRHRPQATSTLELGCGPGWLSIFLAEMGFQTTGYDISPAMIAVAKRRAHALSLDNRLFRVGDMEFELTSEVGRHDVVVIFDALHHIHAERGVFNHAYSYLKPGGILVLAEPNRVHEHDHESVEVVKRFGTTERGLAIPRLRRLLRAVGFRKNWRYHASGQSFEPRHEGFVETLKMLAYPFLARFYFGGTRTRIWLVAEKGQVS
jgi:SAM-dependent methyltransferase